MEYKLSVDPLLDEESDTLEPYKIIPNFVSKHVRNYLDLLNEKNVSIKPIAIETNAAVVMVDVSGYSTLSSVLAERGPIGAELLSKTMKDFLDQVVIQ